MHDQGTYSIIRKVMALPFLPEEDITPVFKQLQQKATTPSLQQFLSYVEDTWIRSTTWPPTAWSVYRQSIHTNNDVEGWHNGLNRRAQGKCQLPLYMLISLLHQESCLAALQIRLVSERKLHRIQRRSYRELQARIFTLWDEFESGEKSAKQLLKACSHLYGPRAD